MTKQNLCTDNVFKIHSVYVWKSCFFVGEYKYLRSWHKCLGNGYPYEINWGILFNLTQLQFFSPSCIILCIWCHSISAFWRAMISLQWSGIGYETENNIMFWTNKKFVFFFHCSNWEKFVDKIGRYMKEKKIYTYVFWVVRRFPKIDRPN